MQVPPAESFFCDNPLTCIDYTLWLLAQESVLLHNAVSQEG